MNDDELTERLASTLREEASKVTSPPDAWERYTAVAPVVPLRARPDRRLWLTAPAGAVGIAAAIALVVMVLRSGGSTDLKASSSASAPFAAAGRAAGPQGAAAPSPSLAAGANGSTSGSPASPSPGLPAAPSPGLSSPGLPSSGSPSSGLPGAAGLGVASGAAPAGSGPAGGPVPAGFGPASVTFVSPSEGWVLGSASCVAPPCTSILRTTDGGSTWVGVPAPAVALSPGGGAPGVSEIRFATPMDGWVYGPDLWATHDGGATWHRVALDGSGQVSALEASAGRVWAAVLDDTSARVRLFGSPVGSDAWAAAPVDVQIGAGPVPSTQIVLQGSSGWLIEVDRTVVGGARLVNGRWVSWTPPCAAAEGPALLASSASSSLSSPPELVAACDVGLWGGSSPPKEVLYVSRDGGASFAAVQGSVVPTGGGTVDGVAAPVPGTVVIASSGSLYLSSDGGATWTATSQAQQASSRDLGFTTPSQGVVVVRETAAGTSVLLVTRDGGHHWSPLRF